MLFSDKPGSRERHIKRKYQNPLFGEFVISQADIEQAQQLDAQDVDLFMNQFRDLVQRAANLEPNAEADEILKIKEQLDKSYEQCSGLAGDQSEIKDMLKRLVKVIMQTMWGAVGQDMQAHSKLEMEVQARESHFALLEHTLIVDLLNPQSPIEENELVPTLLSEPAETVKLAMQLFAPEQQAVLIKLGQELLADMQISDPIIEMAKQRLSEMEEMMQGINQMPS